MSNSGNHTHHNPAKPLQSHPARLDLAERPGDKAARREAINGSHLLERILKAPHLEQVIPRLQPSLLHKVVQLCGLEDCGDLVALATPGQLARIFDLDLWRATRPGLDERFDAERFGLWIDVLVESGSAAVAAQKLAGMDVDLVVAGLAQHVLVYDNAAVSPYETTDGYLVEAVGGYDEELASDVGGYLLVARRTDAWEAIVEVLLSLDTEHTSYFHQVMQGCRALSNSGREVDELDELLSEGDQVMFDLAVDRERRREKQGYVAPADARAFLNMSRQLRPRSSSEAVPPANPLTRAYFHAIEERLEAEAYSGPGLLVPGSEVSPISDVTATAITTVFDILHEAGVLPEQQSPPHALLVGAEGQAPRLDYIQAQMQYVLDLDHEAYATRNEEIAYLANVLMAGSSIQARHLTAQEASDAVFAVCNLGLENCPPGWLPANVTSPPPSFLLDHDLVSVFQVGWAVLYQDVSMYAAEQLIEILTPMRSDDRETQRGINALRIKLAKCWRDGVPWRARGELDVVATLDAVAWVVLLALLDEFPVLHAGVGSLRDSRTRSVKPSDFVFISENRQIASVREFMQWLPGRLRR